MISSELPAGYTLDAPPPDELPEGYVLDAPPQGESTIQPPRAAQPPRFSYDAIRAELKRRGAIPPGADEMQMARRNIPGQAIAGAASASRVPLEMGGATAGGIAGFTAGGPAVSAVGSGLGYSLGAEVADILEQFAGVKDQRPLWIEGLEAGKRYSEGVAWDVGGQTALKPLGYLGKKAFDKLRSLAPLMDTSVKKKVGSIIAADTPAGPWIVENIKKAKEYEEMIPGLKFSRAEMTGDANQIKFERSKTQTPGEFAEQWKGRKAENFRAIRDFINKAKGGEEGLDDVLTPFAKQEQKLAGDVSSTQTALDELGLMGSKTEGTISAGKTIRASAQAGEKAARKAGGVLFDDVPEFGIDGSGLIGKLDEISQPFDDFENIKKNVPEYFETIREVLADKNNIVTPSGLKGMVTNLRAESRKIGGVPGANRFLTSRLDRMAAEADDLLEQASKSGERVGVQPVETPGGATQAEIEDYLVTSNEAQAKASENIKAMRAAEDKEEYAKALNAAKGLVKESPEFAAYQDIIDQGGLNLETAHMGTDKETIKEILRRRPTLLRKGAPTHADQYANQMGFDTPDEMFQDWLSRDTRANQTRKIADDIMNEYYVGKDAGLVHTGPEEFINEEIDMLNSMMSKTRPKGWKQPKTVMEKVVTRAMPGDEQAAAKLKKARTFWKQEVIDKFQSGAVGDILTKGVKGDKVASSQVASQFFKPGAVGEEVAGQFMEAVGHDPGALTAMRDAIRQDMIGGGKNGMGVMNGEGEIVKKKLNQWVFKHKAALKKYGVLKEFQNIESAAKAADEAVKMQSAFNKSEASKLLNGNINTKVRQALNAGQKKQSAQRLMDAIRNNPQAKKGLQNAFIDEMMKGVETTGVDAFGKEIMSVAKISTFLKDFDEPLKVIFAGEKNKLAAMYRVRDALRVIDRTAKSPIGGGSDTAENLAHGASRFFRALIAKTAKVVSPVTGTISLAATPIKMMSDSRVGKLINRSLLDPDLAHDLVWIANGKYKPEVVKRKLSQHFATMGLVSQGDKLNDKK